MKSEGRALLESFALHGLLAGSLITLAGALTPPPKIVRVDFALFEQLPTPPSQAAETTVASPEQPPAIEKPRSEPLPTPPPTPAATARMAPKKIQPIRKENVSQVAAVQTVPSPPTQQEVGDSVQVSASPEPVANSPGNASPATGAPSFDPNEEYRRLNFKGIRDAIIANIRYPISALRRGWSGKVEVTFLITPDGGVSELRIQSSSGYPLLDEQAVEAVRKAAPFTPPRKTALLVMPVSFQLN